jgi:hypothetical protein
MIVINTVTSIILITSGSLNKIDFSAINLLFGIATICGIIAYSFAILRAERSTWDLLFIPVFLFWGAGLIVRMSVGTVVGLIRKGGVFERTPKFNIGSTSIQTKKLSRERIPLDKILMLEAGYTLILIIGIFKTIELGGYFLFSGIYYGFIVLSIINLIVSELLHGFFYDT